LSGSNGTGTGGGTCEQRARRNQLASVQTVESS
jgi:hypothetical protein